MASETGRRFGARMRGRRLELGLTQPQVAARMKESDPVVGDIDKQRIWDWEHGVVPNDRFKPLLVKALEVEDIGYFYESPEKDETPDPFAKADEADLAATVASIEDQVSEIRDALLGDGADAQLVAGVAVRLLQAAGLLQLPADEPPETPPADEQPGSA